MSDKQSTRRKFLKFLGISAGATLASSGAVAAISNTSDMRTLNPEQQEFMTRYNKWMDEFTEVIRIQKSDPDNTENNKRMEQLSKSAEAFQPELKEFMKDKVFEVVFKESIKRVTAEI